MVSSHSYVSKAGHDWYMTTMPLSPSLSSEMKQVIGYRREQAFRHI